jgi:hypothetical protein
MDAAGRPLDPPCRRRPRRKDMGRHPAISVLHPLRQRPDIAAGILRSLRRTVGT